MNSFTTLLSFPPEIEVEDLTEDHPHYTEEREGKLSEVAPDFLGNWLVKSPGGEFLITHQEVELSVPYKRKTLGWVIEKKGDPSAVHICETAEEMRDYILSASC